MSAETRPTHCSSGLEHRSRARSLRLSGGSRCASGGAEGLNLLRSQSKGDTRRTPAPKGCEISGLDPRISLVPSARLCGQAARTARGEPAHSPLCNVHSETSGWHRCGHNAGYFVFDGQRGQSQCICQLCSAFPSTNEYRVDVGTSLPRAFQQALIQAVRESKELGHNIQATLLLKSLSLLPGTPGVGTGLCGHAGSRRRGNTEAGGVRELTQLVDVFIRTLVRLDR